MSDMADSRSMQWMIFLQGCYRLMVVANREGMQAIVKHWEPCDVGPRFFAANDLSLLRRPIELFAAVLGSPCLIHDRQLALADLACCDHRRFVGDEAEYCIAMVHLARCVIEKVNAYVTIREIRYLIPRGERPGVKELDEWVLLHGEEEDRQVIVVPGESVKARGVRRVMDSMWRRETATP